MRNHLDKLLKVFPLFRTGPPRLHQDLLACATPFSCPARTMLYFEGDSCSQIGLLLAGEIRVYKTSESGREITLYEIGAGETCILNASSILANTPYPADAVALTACELIMIPAPILRRLTKEYEEMQTYVFSLLSNRLVEVMSLVEEVAFGKMDQRLLDYLIEKSQSDLLAATHQTIANDLGTSREVVSRLLKDFERKGKVRLSRNRIELLLS